MDDFDMQAETFVKIKLTEDEARKLSAELNNIDDLHNYVYLKSFGRQLHYTLNPAQEAMRRIPSPSNTNSA